MTNKDSTPKHLQQISSAGPHRNDNWGRISSRGVQDRLSCPETPRPLVFGKVWKLLPAGESSEFLLVRNIRTVIWGKDVKGRPSESLPFHTAELDEPPVSQHWAFIPISCIATKGCVSSGHKCQCLGCRTPGRFGASVCVDPLQTGRQPWKTTPFPIPKWAPLCVPPVPVNRTRDGMSPRTGRQIYGPPDVADLQPLFNLQIPATWRSYSWSPNL